jgi:anaerobic selenocysteine-containing dehydrogenase
VGFEQALEALGGFDPDLAAGAPASRTAPSRVWRPSCTPRPAPRCTGRVGVSTQAFGTLCQWLIQVINLYCGNLDREGGVAVQRGGDPAHRPGTARGHLGALASRVRGLPEFAGSCRWRCWRGDRHAGDGQVRALITIAGNPVLSTPNGRALSNRARAAGFMLAIDIYLNETTRHAHLILPPASPLTQDHYDLIFNALAVRRVARLSQPLRRATPTSAPTGRS